MNGAAHQSMKDRRGRLRILVVEDEDAVRGLVTRYLGRLGYQISSAENGIDALRVLDSLSQPPQLLLSDVMMPEMDGPTLARTLRREQPDLKILFVSGYADNRFAIQGLKRSDYTFMAKPFALRDLANTVQELLSEHLLADSSL